MTVGQRIQELRKAAGLSQERLGELIRGAQDYLKESE